MHTKILAGLVIVGLAACGEQARIFPIVLVARAIGWPPGVSPTPAPGLAVQAFATGLDHPRWLTVLPNGDVLVVETRAPPRPQDNKGIKGWIFKKLMARAGAAGPSANRITLLRDADGDGVAELRSDFLRDLHSPFGMALVGQSLYVANTDGVLRFPYRSGETAIEAAPVRVAELPAGPLNRHWTRNLLASRDGTRLYVTVGSNSNAGENGIDNEAGRAGIIEIDLLRSTSRVFATGLRNPNGMGWEPHSGALWTVVSERDELGNETVPDYLSSVKEGGFYGWPATSPGRHAIVPDYPLGGHVTPLGLAFYEGKMMPQYAGGAIIGQHGSWNRNPRSGYNVVFVPFVRGRPAGKPGVILDGFISPTGEAYGRPAGVAVDKAGALLVADDVGNSVWRVVQAK